MASIFDDTRASVDSLNEENVARDPQLEQLASILQTVLGEKQQAVAALGKGYSLETLKAVAMTEEPSAASITIGRMIMAYVYGERWFKSQWEEFAAHIMYDAKLFNDNFLVAAQKLNNLQLLEQIIQLSNEKLILDETKNKSAVITQFYETFMSVIKIEIATLEQQKQLVLLAQGCANAREQTKKGTPSRQKRLCTVRKAPTVTPLRPRPALQLQKTERPQPPQLNEQEQEQARVLHQNMVESAQMNTGDFDELVKLHKPTQMTQEVLKAYMLIMDPDSYRFTEPDFEDFRLFVKRQKSVRSRKDISEVTKEDYMAPAFSVRMLAVIVDRNGINLNLAGSNSRASMSIAAFIVSWLNWQKFLHNMKEEDYKNFSPSRTQRASSARRLNDTQRSSYAVQKYDYNTQRWQSNSAAKLSKTTNMSPPKKATVKRPPPSVPIYKWVKQIDSRQTSPVIQNWINLACAIVATISDKAIQKAYQLKSVRKRSAQLFAKAMCIILEQQAIQCEPLGLLKNHLRQPEDLRRSLLAFPNGTAKTIELVAEIKKHNIKKDELQAISPVFKLLDDYVDVWLIANVEMLREGLISLKKPKATDKICWSMFTRKLEPKSDEQNEPKPLVSKFEAPGPKDVNGWKRLIKLSDFQALTLAALASPPPALRILWNILYEMIQFKRPKAPRSKEQHLKTYYLSNEKKLRRLGMEWVFNYNKEIRRGRTPAIAQLLNDPEFTEAALVQQFVGGQMLFYFVHWWYQWRVELEGDQNAPWNTVKKISDDTIEQKVLKFVGNNSVVEDK